MENPTEPQERKADLNLGDKLKAEASGILAWMVRGCLRFQREGLKVPDQVRAAVARYREEEDIIGNFVEECCILDATVETTKGDLHRAYRAWCDDNGVKPLGRKRFFKDFDLRFDSYDNGRHQAYIGVKVLE